MTYIVKKNDELSNKDLDDDSHNSYDDDLLDDQSRSSNGSNKSLDDAKSLASNLKSSARSESIENVGLLKKSRGISYDKSNNDSE